MGHPAARVVVFVDYQNVHLTARFAYLSAAAWQGHVDPVRLAELIVSRRSHPSTLTGVRVYRGRPSPTREPTAAAANDRRAAAWTRDTRVEVIRRPLCYPPGWPDLPSTEKGVDVRLGIDLVRLAVMDRYDVGVLFSRDSDLLPALELVRDLGKRVEVAGWVGTTRLRFPGTDLPWCHYLGEAEYRRVCDRTRYSQP